MKAAVFLFATILATGVYAQRNNDDRTLTSPARIPPKTPTIFKPAPPNQIKGERFTYSGSLVQAFNARNPLQLLNPLAPQPEPARENVTREIRTKKVNGLRLFSLEF